MVKFVSVLFIVSELPSENEVSVPGYLNPCRVFHSLDLKFELIARKMKFILRKDRERGELTWIR